MLEPSNSFPLHSDNKVQLLSLAFMRYRDLAFSYFIQDNPCTLQKILPHPPHMPMSSHLFLPSIFPSIRVSFQVSQFFASGGQSIGVSGSASVLPMNTQDCSDGLLGWTGLISLQSKGLSRVFSNITVQKHQFSVLSFLNSPTLTSIPSDTTIFCYLVYLKYQFINHIFFFFFFLVET